MLSEPGSESRKKQKSYRPLVAKCGVIFVDDSSILKF